MKILLALSLLGAVYWAAAQQSELHRLLAIGSNKGNNRLSWTPVAGPPAGTGRFFGSNPFFLPWGLGYLSMLLPTSTKTVTSVTLITLSETASPFCIQPGSAVLSVCNPLGKRRRRGLENGDEDPVLFLDGQPISPSQVAKMAMTELPSMTGRDRREPSHLISSSMMDPDPAEERSFMHGNNYPYNKWYFVTTSTSTLTAVTITTVNNGEIRQIYIDGSCLPSCLTTLPIC